MLSQPFGKPQVTGGSGFVLQVAEDYDPSSRGVDWTCSETRIDRIYTNRLKVYTSSRTVGPIAVLYSLPCRIGDPYIFPLITTGPTETDPGSFLRSVRAAPSPDAQDNRQWTVTLEYEPFDVVSLLGNSDIGYGIINPLDAALVVYWSEPAKYQIYKPEDESGGIDPETGEQTPGAPYLNTIGQPLLNPPATEESRPILFVVRNESQYDDEWASTFKDTVNSDEFLGYPPNTVKCRDIKGERQYDADWGWWFRVTYQFEFRDDDDGNGFTTLIANMGYQQKVNGSGNPVNVVDANGATITDAVPLQKDGSYQPGEEPYFIPFQAFPMSEFAQLNIPDDILYVASGNS